MNAVTRNRILVKLPEIKKNELLGIQSNIIMSLLKLLEIETWIKDRETQFKQLERLKNIENREDQNGGSKTHSKSKK